MEMITSMCCWPAVPAYPNSEDDPTETSPILSPAALPTYLYSNILPEEFRIVILHPAQRFGDDIKVHIQTRQRSDIRCYEAVSYTWGTDEHTEPLLVYDEKFATSYLHGQCLLTRMLRYHQVRDQANATMHVRSNVATMLRYLRYKWLPRYLWIDAISINQTNMGEKSHQVNRMGDIYRKSRRTLIWLGCSQIYPYPLSALEHAARTQRSSRWGKYDKIKMNEIDGDDQAGASANGLYSLRKSDFRHILSLPWFHRRWVIQEVALSPRPRAVFGHDVMSFEDMTYFINQLVISFNETLNSSSIADSLHMLESMTSLQRRNSFPGNSFFTKLKHDVFYQYYRHHPKTNETTDFVQLLVSMSSAQCSDDRDRIYALNSLGGRPTLVDYHASTEEVFTRFAIEECTHSLETLYCCGSFPSQTLPSFVPDWRSSCEWLPIKSFEGRLPSHLLLSDCARQPNSPPYRPIFFDCRVMMVKAISFTCVLMKGSRLHDGWASQPWHSLKKIMEQYSRSEDLGVTSAHSLDRLVKTVTAGAIHSGSNLEGWFHFEKPLQGSWTDCDDDPNTFCDCRDKSFCAYPSMHINIYNILQKIDRIMRGRCTFVSQRGDWGIGPASILSGDQIFALPGCRYPFILRSATTGPPGAFTIVGDCYITPFEGFEDLTMDYTVRTISIV